MGERDELRELSDGDLKLAEDAAWQATQTLEDQLTEDARDLFYRVTVSPFREERERRQAMLRDIRTDVEWNGHLTQVRVADGEAFALCSCGWRGTHAVVAETRRVGDNLDPIEAEGREHAARHDGRWLDRDLLRDLYRLDGD